MQIGTNFPYSAEYSGSVRSFIDAGLNPFDAAAEAELDYIELAVHHRLNRAELDRDIEELHTRGLSLHLHPYHNCQGFGTPGEARFMREDLESIIEAADMAAQHTGRAVNINFHAASGGAAAGRETLLRQSHAFNAWLTETVERLKADVMITTEHQLPPKSGSAYIRIGDNFPELMDMVAFVDHGRFQSCWDMGHSMMRVAWYDSAVNPPNAYVPLVKHVHIHDVTMSTPEDHRPIGTADSPLSNFVGLLLQSGYSGAFTMEYQASEFFNDDYVDFLRRSKHSLLQLAGVNAV